jgi:hypothetical protein
VGFYLESEVMCFDPINESRLGGVTWCRSVQPETPGKSGKNFPDPANTRVCAAFPFASRMQPEFRLLFLENFLPVATQLP